YMAPEQRRGLPADPRHDLYSLGVLWYQLLVGDVTRELHPGWARELTVRFNVPKAHVELIERCVGWIDERPAHAGELVALLRGRAPTSAPVGDMRRPLLVSLVEGLTASHADAARLDAARWNWVWWTGGAAFFLFMTLVESYRLNPGLAVFLTALPAVGLGATLYLINRHRLATAHERAAETVGTLKAGFPDEVAGWGGEAVLNDPTTASALLERLTLPEPPPAPSLTAAQRQELTAALKDLQERQRAAVGEARPFSFFPALLLAAVAAAALGVGAVAARMALRAPLWRYDDFATVEYRTHAGQALSAAENTVEMRLQFSHSLTLGVGVAAAAGLSAFILLACLRWHRGRLIATAVLAALAAVPVGLGAGFLTAGLYLPYKAGQPATYHDHQGRELTHLEYDLESRRALAVAHLTGWGAGLLAELVLVAGALTWQSRRDRLARQQLEARVTDVAARFPALGGVEALRERGKVDELLNRLTQAASLGAASSGFRAAR
ncbi:MAG: hypothetical protein ACRC33_23060, partial [Gemmataceae bacterium]